MRKREPFHAFMLCVGVVYGCYLSIEKVRAENPDIWGAIVAVSFAALAFGACVSIYRDRVQ